MKVHTTMYDFCPKNDILGLQWIEVARNPRLKILTQKEVYNNYYT